MKSVKSFLKSSILFFIGFCNLCSSGEDKPYRLVICAIFQNEDFFLKEWLEYHLLIGVEHFYLYNNLSNDNYQEILKPYIDMGVVDLFDWPVETINQKEYLQLLQLPAYNHALNIVKETASWAAFIDLDEFLLPVKHDHLPDILEEFTAYAGVAVNWQIFGTSFLNTLPENALIIESLVYKTSINSGLNEIVKLIVQPSFVESISNPHSFDYCEGCFAVDTQGKKLPPGQMSQMVVIDTLCINHYWYGTMDWFLNHKIPRRKKWGLQISDEQLDALIAIHNQVKDDTILKFVPRLRKNLEIENILKPEIYHTRLQTWISSCTKSPAVEPSQACQY